MFQNHKVVVVFPAYNAEKTLIQTYNEIPFDIVDDLILVDDNSSDKTVEIAKQLNIKHIIVHDKNKGYGANQKSCYNKALELNASIIVMLHPDYQYTPKLIPSMCSLIESGLYDVVLGSRILGGKALNGGMPVYKYIFNRLLTLIQNVIIGEKLSEYHTGYRAFSSKVLKSINYSENCNNFVFDNQILSQILMKGYRIAEITCPTKYFANSSSISFCESVKYGIGVIKVSFKHRIHKLKFRNYKMYQ